MKPNAKPDDDWIGLVDGPVPVADADRFVRDDRAGAVSIFVGTTRRYTEGQETTQLEYESYRDMAVGTFAELVAEARSRWPICRVCVLHTLGRVGPREASVCIAVSTPHRADAFEATRFLIDHLKQEAPIWKKETYRDGSASWVGDQQFIPPQE